MIVNEEEFPSLSCASGWFPKLLSLDWMTGSLDRWKLMVLSGHTPSLHWTAPVSWILSSEGGIEDSSMVEGAGKRVFLGFVISDGVGALLVDAGAVVEVLVAFRLD